jgi:hypothetical protein
LGRGFNGFVTENIKKLADRGGEGVQKHYGRPQKNLFCFIFFSLTNTTRFSSTCDVISIAPKHSDRNNIYKVETVKDSFVGVSGAPERVRRLPCN